MNNAEKFQELFGLYATELWAKPENEFLKWLNAEYTQDEKGRNKIAITKGYWIVTYDGFYCSVCNYKCETTALPHVCPHCGADLRR